MIISNVLDEEGNQVQHQVLLPGTRTGETWFLTRCVIESGIHEICSGTGRTPAWACCLVVVRVSKKYHV